MPVTRKFLFECLALFLIKYIPLFHGIQPIFWLNKGDKFFSWRSIVSFWPLLSLKTRDSIKVESFLPKETKYICLKAILSFRNYKHDKKAESRW